MKKMLQIRPYPQRSMIFIWNMITVSDNESFNELVRLQTASGVFKDGAQAVNGFLAEQKFADTSVQHIIKPVLFKGCRPRRQEHHFRKRLRRASFPDL